MKILLITAGNYISPDIQVDLGQIPPSFLPLGHKILIEIQNNLFKNESFDKKIVSLPEDFKLNLFETKKIDELGFSIHLSSSKQSLYELINEIVKTHIEIKRLTILHGDTLFNKIPDDFDNESVLYTNETSVFYKWFYVNKIREISNKSLVLSGFFSFSDINKLKLSLIKSTTFDELIVQYDVDKSLKLLNGDNWLDFGNSTNYFQSKKNYLMSRQFNKTTSEGNFIKKSSINHEKIKNEYDWFKNLSEEFKQFTPHVWNYKKNYFESSYNIEYISGNTYQEQFVFGRLNNQSLKNLLNKSYNLLKLFSDQKKSKLKNLSINEYRKSIYIDKTFIRYNEFKKSELVDFKSNIIINDKIFESPDEFVKNTLLDIEKILTLLPNFFTLMHGDFCFSNIIFNSRADQIKIIDPRGNNFNENDKCYGDNIYDLVKLGHSIIGNYDPIICNRYVINKKADNNFQFKILKKFDKNIIESYYSYVENEYHITKKDINLLISNLFISMLPLHNEDEERQKAFLINAYKIKYML